MDLVAWETLSFPVVSAASGASALLIAVVGTRMTRAADRLADETGLGEAIFGAVLLGSTTSIAGITTSVTAAVDGLPSLAISNAIGGIAAQTVFLAVADMAYRPANLEHAAASVENLLQGALLSTLLAIPLLGMAGPRLDLFGIHPASVLLVAGYLYGIHLVAEARSTPYWVARQTDKTRQDTGAEGRESAALSTLWLEFVALSLVVGAAGYVIAKTGGQVAARTGLSEGLVGGLFTAVSTSLPELVTSVAAVRRGALTLAVGGIIGGNSFDVLFVAFSDVGYQEGSIYHAMTEQQVFIIALTLLLTGILLMGLLRRERRGAFGIGFESFLALVLYFGAFGLLFV
ncbi:cation:H+ antiporter [Salinibacter ruber]|uniref:sodium:calcium antiporter n=1 Tax=Salinibacter ruber TaxID=146919 RepID=UPI002167E3FD|nr:sodium:calcium antiporter [Salinibacter ruber]MCS3955542.1 cation:H+ antiporter [Salinibacter ruber]